MSEEEWERDFISILLDSNLARKSSQVFLYFDFTLSRVAVSDECSCVGVGLGFLGWGYCFQLAAIVSTINCCDFSTELGCLVTERVAILVQVLA